MRRRKIILHNIIFLCFIYFIIAINFASIYVVIDFFNVGTIVDHYSRPFVRNSFLDCFSSSLYFSFITLLSVGYGDLTPYGFVRVIAIIEAMIGYVLPVAIVINSILFLPKRNPKKFF